MKEIKIIILLPDNYQNVNRIKKMMLLERRKNKEIDYMITERKIGNEKVLVSENFKRNWLSRTSRKN